MKVKKEIKKLNRKVRKLKDKIYLMEAFRCLGCGVDTSWLDEYYMIQDELWFEVNPVCDGMLCIGCVEQRLGRELKSEDFTKVPVNDIEWGFKSERLMNRLNS